MEHIGQLRCEWRSWPGISEKFYVCTADKPSWYEQVDLEDGFFESGLCITGVALGQPGLCIGYAKWFATSLSDVFKTIF